MDSIAAVRFDWTHFDAKMYVFPLNAPIKRLEQILSHFELLQLIWIGQNDVSFVVNARCLVVSEFNIPIANWIEGDISIHGLL